MEDWDLQAIVKGCSSSRPSCSNLMEDPNFDSFLSEEDDYFSCVYPQVFETTAITCCSSNVEFEEGVGSSIYPVLHSLIPHPNNSPSISDLVREFKEPEKLHQKKQIAPNKQKQSKKSKQNRVVKEVRADSVCSDSWGWRKYGQKPIKGSPYPRSYYRCSSSKGCSARKQVERSLSDPDVFLVTYTAEHNHSEPTRRNALAGTTRKKFPPPQNNVPNNLPALSSSSPNNSTFSAASLEFEEQPPEGLAGGEVLINLPFGISSQDLFPGLEDYLLFG